MANGATLTTKAVILPDEIQKTLKDLTFSYTPANSSERWFYGLINVRDSATSLIQGHFIEPNVSGVKEASSSKSAFPIWSPADHGPQDSTLLICGTAASHGL